MYIHNADMYLLNFFFAETNGIDLQPNPPTTDAKADEEKDDKKKKLNSVGLLEIFAFADKWDVFLIIFGMIGAVVAGAIFPLMFAVFGNITTGFTNYQVQHELAQCDSQCFGDYGENDTISQQCEAIDETLKDNMNTVSSQNHYKNVQFKVAKPNLF